MTVSKEAPNIYQLKITLKYIKPPIWRRFLVNSDIKLTNLHGIIQEIMGWSNCHLYSFDVDDQGYADRKFWEEDWYYSDLEDANKIKLQDIMPTVGSKCSYTYDFGDGWEHTILLEKILEPEPGVKYPLCLTGRRNCPPEDCGGIWGYNEILNYLKDPENEEYEELRDWIEPDYDPERFDCIAINEIITKMGKPRRTSRKTER